jgi:mRNA interferase MazF
VHDIRRGEIWWVDLTLEPRGSDPGFRRPVVIVQDDFFNRSSLATIVVVAVTRNLALRNVPANVLLSRRETGLKRDCVANVSALITVDRAFFANPGVAIGKLGVRAMARIEAGLSLILSL